MKGKKQKRGRNNNEENNLHKTKESSQRPRITEIDSDERRIYIYIIYHEYCFYNDLEERKTKYSMIPKLHFVIVIIIVPRMFLLYAVPHADTHSHTQNGAFFFSLIFCYYNFFLSFFGTLLIVYTEHINIYIHTYIMYINFYMFDSFVEFFFEIILCCFVSC